MRFDPLRAGVERVVVEEDDPDAALADVRLDLADDVLRAPHADVAAPVDGRRAEVAVERTAAAGHDVDGLERRRGRGRRS